MTQNQRIVLNIVATYGRSLYAMVIGLFSARWVLGALGVVDFGLYGVIGGLVMFVTFVNNLLQMAVGRFYAVKVGEANVAESKEQGVDECRKWFNTALLIHSVIPFVLVAVGYPVGEWAIRNFLTIPPDRVADCVWVWRFTCLSGFVAMCAVPFQAMYTAKQEIAELTLYGFAQTTLNAVFFYYMSSHPGVWLKRYALWMCGVHVIPNIVIAMRAVVKYPECRIRRAYLWSAERMRQLFIFAGARFVTAVSNLFFTQGQSVLVNKYFGPVFNSAITIGNQVSGQVSTLSSSLSQAFWPAIANAAGEKNYDRMKRLTFVTCRFGTILLLIFAIPLSLEIDEVLLLWLKTPPPFAAELCVVILTSMILNRSTEGYWMAIFGIGRKVAQYSFVVGWTGLIGFFTTYALLLLGVGRWSVCFAYLISHLLAVLLRLYLGRRLAGLSVWQWVKTVALPLGFVSGLPLMIGFLPRFICPPNLLRIFVTTAIVEVVLLPLLWLFVLSTDERDYVIKKIWRTR